MTIDGGKRILLVEDNPSDEELTMMAFEKNRIKNQIVVAHDGEEAIGYLAQIDNIDNLPQIVILDLKLPKIDGLEVLRYIRSNEHTKFLPVVILTSSKEDRDLVEAYALGTNAYIRKPVDFNEFIQAVQYLGLFWLLLNEYPNAQR